MTNSEIQALLSSTRWSEDAFYLKEFVHKHKLPQVAKVGRESHYRIFYYYFDTNFLAIMKKLS